MRMSTRQLERLTAFSIDPLLAKSVEIDDTPILSRTPRPAEYGDSFNEIYATGIWKQRREKRTGKRWFVPFVIVLFAVGVAMPTKHTTTVVADTDPCPTLSIGASGEAVT